MKLRIKWLAGAALLCLAVFAAMLMAVTNTPDARMERVISEVIDEYGFEEFFEHSTDFGGSAVFSFQSYTVKSSDENHEERIFAQLSRACEDCTVEYIEQSPVNDQSTPITLIKTGEEYDSLDSFFVRFQDATIVDGVEVDSYLMLQIVRRNHGQGILNKLRRWLPW